MSAIDIMLSNCDDIVYDRELNIIFKVNVKNFTIFYKLAPIHPYTEASFLA